jgi:polyhydroxyalkanoate synthesis regulator protein
MPTTNPRITITLTPGVAAVLRELSKLAGNSQSAIVGELLETSLPVFERVVSALRAAATIQESAKTEIASGLERAQSKLEKQMGLMLGDMDETMRPLLEQAEKVARRGAAPIGAATKRGRTPVPLTGGSGHPKVGKNGKRAGGQRGRV